MCAIALGALWAGQDWEAGTLATMEAGYFPRLVSGLLLALGLALVVMGLRRDGPPLSGWAWRPVIVVSLSVLAFAATLERLGLVVAILALIGVGSFAGPSVRPLALLVLWIVLAAFCVALFAWGLRLPLKVWP